MKNIAGSSNGRTPGFGPGYLGSSPGPAANKCYNNFMKILGKIILWLIVIMIILWIVMKIGESKTNIPPVGGDDTGNEITNLETYRNATAGFSIKYPKDFAKDETYVYQNLGPGKDISGVKFTIPATMSVGTNLASDSYISLEWMNTNTGCSAQMFLMDGAQVNNITETGQKYSYGTTMDAAAGNRYEEYVYAIPGTNPCIAIRYMIHYGAFENYEPGMVKEFDKTALIKDFDDIRHTLSVNQ